MVTLSGELGSYLAASGRVWVEHPPKKKISRKPVAGPPVGDRDQQAIADCLKPRDAERIRLEAKAAAAEALRHFEIRRSEWKP